MNLIEQVKRVADLRLKQAELKEKKEALFADWENLHRELLNDIITANLDTQKAEETLRNEAIISYEIDGNRKPVPGVEIKLFTRLSYETGKAFDWALDHKISLSLDKKIFETLAKVNPPPFVTIRQEPMAQIATDLSKEIKE